MESFHARTFTVIAVLQGGRLKKGERVAIKRIDKARAQMMSSTHSLSDMLKGEVGILKKLNNKHIVRLKDVYDTTRYFYIVLE